MTFIIDSATQLIQTVAAINSPTRLGEFILDTGSTLCYITPEAAKDFGVDRGRFDNVRIQGSGHAYDGKPVLLESVTLGGVTVHHVEAMVVDDLPIAQPLAGILGMSFLGKLKKFELSFIDNRITVA